VVSKRRRSRERAARRAVDDPAIADLLDTVREVRTNLAIDLSAAAGALEENQPSIARDILSATSEELPHLSGGALEGAAARRRSRRARVLLALPAVPIVGALAMTTAAALSGGAKPTHHAVAEASPLPSVSASVPAQHTAASTALRRLQQVVNEHAQAARVIGAADDLHKQLTRMIATSTNNPAQLHVVQQLLKLEQHVLEGSKLPGTQLALAASRAIAQLLQNGPSHSTPNHSFTAPRATPTSARTTHAQPASKPTPTRVQRAPQPRRSAATSHESPAPKPTNALFGDGFLNWP
jgi:hypothetical protein